MTQKRIDNIPNLKNKELSIQVSLSGLSFCVLNRFDNAIESVGYFEFENVTNPEQLLPEIESLFDNSDLFLNPRKVTVFYVNELSAFVPGSLFSEENMSDYLKFNVKILENDYLTHDEIRNGDLVNVYVPYTNINNFFFDLFGEFEFKHYSTILMETLLNNSPKTEEAVMYVHTEKEHFEIVVLKNRKLLFYNSFQYETKEDFLYYILFTAEQLDMNPENFELRFLGNIKEGDPCYDIAYNYVRNVSVDSSFASYDLPEENTVGDHSLFLLQNSF
ncbi:DUF3822 family protein [Leptobacterium flavescens]|uniref:DUF3822 family protein n=1 Tax=Leptobacterium flavescens TaxID=472055 RepID=A0A6P0UHI1_9FLAO|nr:DUF3822 family protein [Leptobacterium flavescens]NER11910.1 DUF3822 family protein [Leptobacterium flavescens]